MAGQIRMTPETMRTRSREAGDQAANMEALRTRMERLLNDLRREWEGDAMEGYEQRFNEIRPVLKKAKDLLDEISHNLSKTADIVQQTDEGIGRQFRGGN